MRRDIKNKKVSISPILFLPIVTIIVVGILFYFSNAYMPSWTFNWTGIRKEIKDTALLIENYGDITTQGIGETGNTPQQWYRRKWFLKNATDEELLKLTEYPNGAVKATAYEALIKNGYYNNYELLSKALNDTTTFFNYQSGCVGHIVMVGEYLVLYVLLLHENSPPVPENFYQYLNLSKEEIDIIKTLSRERLEKKWWYFNKYYDWRK